VPTDRKIDGVDMLPWLVGEEKLSTAPRETFLFYRGLELQAVRLGDFKYHLQSGELFQLSSDIGETTDVASKHPDVIERIQQICDDVDTDLGVKDVGPGCRELGTISDPVPLIAHD
jgi:arylsulfatase A